MNVEYQLLTRTIKIKIMILHLIYFIFEYLHTSSVFTSFQPLPQLPCLQLLPYLQLPLQFMTYSLITIAMCSYIVNYISIKMRSNN